MTKQSPRRPNRFSEYPIWWLVNKGLEFHNPGANVYHIYMTAYQHIPGEKRKAVFIDLKLAITASNSAYISVSEGNNTVTL